MRLCLLTAAVCIVYVTVAIVSPAVGEVIVVPCIALIVLPTLWHNLERERIRRNPRSIPSRDTVGV